MRKSILPACLVVVLFSPLPGHAVTVKSFIETVPGEKYVPPVQTEDLLDGSSQKNRFKKFSDRAKVPGFIAAAPIADVGKIIGPNSVSNSFRIGDTLFVRWHEGPDPKVGDRYATYTPAVVLQNETDPSEFNVLLRRGDDSIPKGRGLSGYFYETTGEIRITQISQGLVEAVIENLSGQISLDDHLMPVLAMVPLPQPIVGGIQLNANIVAGSPVDRLSTSERSFFYINRGSKDGMKPGRIIQAMENVPLEGFDQGKNMIAGEAMIVRVSDQYSTAMITNQFDVIRVGALLTTKQPNSGATPKRPFYKFDPNFKEEISTAGDYQEIPTLESLEESQDPSLPDPTAPKLAPAAAEKRRAMPTMSELDAIEKSQKFQALDAAERKRLGTLSRQEKIGDGTEEEDPAAPSVAPLDNSFGEAPTPAGKPKKKRATKSRDEEELNQLMMQN